MVLETLHFDEKLSCSSFEFFSTWVKKKIAQKKAVKMMWVIIPETIFRPSKGAFGRLLLTFVLAAGVGVGFDTVLVWILEIEKQKGKITKLLYFPILKIVRLYQIGNIC